MKTFILIATILSIIFGSVYGQILGGLLTNGVPFSSFETQASSYECTYLAFEVPPGASHVSVQGTTTNTDEIYLSFGFNYLPVSGYDSSVTGSSFLYYNYDLYSGTDVDFIFSGFSTQTYFGGDSSEKYDESYIQGAIPNLWNGGTLFVCVVSGSGTVESGITITANYYNFTSSFVLSNDTSISVPLFTGTGSQSLQAWGYQVYVPSNITYFQIDSAQGTTYSLMMGLIDGTGTDASLGEFSVGQWYQLYLVIDSASTATDTITFSNSQFQCDGNTTFAYADSGNSPCLTVESLVSGAPVNLNFTVNEYQLFTITAPTAVPASTFYQLNVSFTGGFEAYVYLHGASQFFEDSNVYGWGTYAEEYTEQYVDATTTQVAGHYIAAGSKITFLVEYYGSSVYTTTMTATFYSESWNQIYVTSNWLNLTAPYQSVTGPTADVEYKVLIPTWINTTYNLNLTVVSANTLYIDNINLFSWDFSWFLNAGYFTDDDNVFGSLYIPSGMIPTGQYYLYIESYDSGQVAYDVTYQLFGTGPVSHSSGGVVHHSSGTNHNSGVVHHSSGTNHNSGVVHHSSGTHQTSGNHAASSGHHEASGNMTTSTHTSGGTKSTAKSTKSSATTSTISVAVVALIAVLSVLFF